MDSLSLDLIYDSFVCRFSVSMMQTFSSQKRRCTKQLVWAGRYEFTAQHCTYITYCSTSSPLLLDSGRIVVCRGPAIICPPLQYALQSNCIPSVMVVVETVYHEQFVLSPARQFHNTTNSGSIVLIFRPSVTLNITNAAVGLLFANNRLFNNRLACFKASFDNLKSISVLCNQVWTLEHLVRLSIEVEKCP